MSLLLVKDKYLIFTYLSRGPNVGGKCTGLQREMTNVSLRMTTPTQVSAIYRIVCRRMSVALRFRFLNLSGILPEGTGRIVRTGVMYLRATEPQSL